MLNYLTADQITGVYDQKTGSRGQQFMLMDNNLLYVQNDSCSEDTFNAVMAIKVVEQTTTTTTETTTAPTTAPTEPVVENYSVRIVNTTKLFRKANEKSTVLYWLDSGNKYPFVEEMTADGKLWYCIQYSKTTSGWVIAANAEKIPSND